MSLIGSCFRRITSSMSSSNEIKGYKVTNVDRTRKFGIACKNFQEFKRKACLKFNLSNGEEKNVAVYLIDGSEIDDDYFLTVEPQTTLILRRPGEEILSDADILYNTLRQVNLEYITTGDAISKFLSNNLKTKIAVLNKAINKDDSKTALSSRDDHPEWFEHLDTTVNTKEAYMHRRCQDRIRSYLYKTVDQIKSSELYSANETAQRHLVHAIEYFKHQLREDHCFGFYFDRSRAKDVEEENLGKELRSCGDSDERDEVLRRCYDHCPCRIRVGRNHFVGDEILEKFFTTAEESFDKEATNDSSDQLDARKASPAKKSKILNEEDSSPYKIDRAIGDREFALCDRNGEFNCEGVWNSSRCSYGKRHSINPYRSYEELVLFSTWNFDHRIERSRTLVPNLLLEASKEKPISQNNIRYFYDNIFTSKNLRLVHIICHDKGAHK